MDGVAIRVSHLVQALTSAGHAVHIVTSIRTNNEPLFGATVTSLPGFVSAYYLGHSLTVPTFGLLRAMMRFRPHVVHILDESFVQAGAQAFASLCLLPTVFSHHSRLDKFAEAYFPILRDIEFPISFYGIQLLRRIFAAQSDVHLAVGTDMQRHLEISGCGPDISQWVCGVNTDVFNPSRCARDVGEGSLRWRLTAGRPHLPIVLYCGRVAPEKRLERLPEIVRGVVARLRAGGCAQPEDSGPCVAVVVVGSGPFLEPLQQLMADLGPTYTLDARARTPAAPLAAGPAESRALLGGAAVASVATTVFCGEVAHGDDLGSIYATADAFASPSTCETLGQVFQEAMAAGTVPVGAAFGGE